MDKPTYRGDDAIYINLLHELSCDKSCCKSGHVIFVTLIPDACKYDARSRNCYIDLNGKGIYLGSENVRCGSIMRSV